MQIRQEIKFLTDTVSLGKAVVREITQNGKFRVFPDKIRQLRPREKFEQQPSQSWRASAERLGESYSYIK